MEMILNWHDNKLNLWIIEYFRVKVIRKVISYDAAMCLCCMYVLAHIYGNAR